ncbi:MAG: hypothetical protein V7647_3918, partial [Acidobacteriota bacterium]
MTKADLAQRLQGAAAGAPPEAHATVVIDVRLTHPCEDSTIPLPGAFRMTATDIPPAPFPPNREIVGYDP